MGSNEQSTCMKWSEPSVPCDSRQIVFLVTNSHVCLYQCSPSSQSAGLIFSLKMEKKFILLSRDLPLLKHDDCYKIFWHLLKFFLWLWGRCFVSFPFMSLPASLNTTAQKCVCIISGLGLWNYRGESRDTEKQLSAIPVYLFIKLPSI